MALAIKIAKEALEKAKLEHKMQVEDIKHMQKMLDEKNALNNERNVFEAERKAEAQIVEIRKTYAIKLETELNEERKKMQDVMNKVMEALPNVNVKMRA